jgi:hypothetical protein
LTVITDVAQRILDENGYTVSDISLLNAEYLVKNAVDYINLQAGTSIAFVPVAGSENLSASDSEIAVVKPLSALLVRAYVDRGPNTAVSSISASTVTNDPQYTLFMQLVNDGISRLRGRSFDRT